MDQNLKEKIQMFSKKMTKNMSALTTKYKDAYKGKNTVSAIKDLPKKKVAMGMTAVLTVGVLGGSYMYINRGIQAYSVEFGGNSIAIVEQKEAFMEILDQVKSEAEKDFGQEVVLDQEPSFVEVEVKKSQMTEADAIIEGIKNQVDIKIRAVAIVVDGEPVVTVKDEGVAENILSQVKQTYLEKDESAYEDIVFLEKVETVEVGSDLSSIMSEEEAIQKIAIGTDEERIHEVQQGDNTWSIARQYDLKTQDIEKANPGLNPEKLKIGQKLSLIVPKPLVSVVTKEYVELVEAIPFETEYEDTDTLYKGDKKITAQGAEGQREVKGYLIKENGVQVTIDVTEEKIVSEPKTRVIAQGTKTRPATVATGYFANPTRGSLTSSFGMRWGRRHNGIDIAAAKGTPIYAADAGRVSFSGYKNSFGNIVIIDHENGYQTYYAHNSKNTVKAGDRVHKGQKIGEMGSTGNSTGVHLHFEVRKNGNPINPRSYVSY